MNRDSLLAAGETAEHIPITKTAEQIPIAETAEQIPIANDAEVPLYALVIGIDEYNDGDNLQGCVADANEIVAYLQDHLKVHEDRIKNLRNGEATRQAILEAFRALQGDPRIKQGDAIFIYFAGHGGETNAPDGWDAGGDKIQVIVTHDTGFEKISPIPDRTIAALLNDLAREKGDNITVVFDCCHSTSGTRGDKNVPGRVARVADVSSDLPSDLDKDIIKPDDAHVAVGRNMKVPTGFLQVNLRSHVLLAACGAKELAYEDQGRGAFTKAFIETLIAAGADKVTYTGLMERLPSLPKQNPQCEGYNKDRILFNAKAPGADRFFVPIEQQGETYTLKAGIAQGITIGSEFAVYARHIIEPASNPSLCTLRVTAIRAFRATLEPLPNTTPCTLPNPAYARQVRCGPGSELRVHFSDALLGLVDLDAVRQAALDADEAGIGFSVTDPDNAQLLVDVDNENTSRVMFSTTNARAKDYGVSRLSNPVEATLENILHVLRSAAHWNRHLNRTTPNPFNGTIHLEFTRLEKVVNEHDGHISTLNPVDEDMNLTGVVDIVVNPEHLFGVRIVNNTDRDLYPYMFYFDVSEQSIENYYLGSIGKDKVDPPLSAGSSLTIGYGAGGGDPFHYFLSRQESLDLGFLKVFLTTSQTNFGSLDQESPFKEIPFKEILNRKMSKRTLFLSDQWYTIMTTIVQRRKPRETE